MTVKPSSLNPLNTRLLASWALSSSSWSLHPILQNECPLKDEAFTSVERLRRLLAVRLGVITLRGNWSCVRDVLEKETFAVLQQDVGEIGGMENTLYLVSSKASRPPGIALGVGWGRLASGASL